MKKFLTVLIIITVAVTLTTPVYAVSGWEKVTGGVEKFIKSPLNVPDNIKAEYDSAEFKPFGVFGGLLKGLAEFAIDGIGGIVDVLTFPIDFEKL